MIEEIGTGKCDASPKENCASTPQVIAELAPNLNRNLIPPLPDVQSGVTIADWRESLVRAGYFEAVEVVGGELGPIAAIGSPRVCVGFANGCTVVWMERRPWGWSEDYKLFLTDRRNAAIKYALALKEQVRKAAVKEDARRSRLREAKLRERFGFLNVGGDR